MFCRMDLLDDQSSSNITPIFEVPGVKTSDIALRILEESELFHDTTGRFL